MQKLKQVRVRLEEVPSLFGNRRIANVKDAIYLMMNDMQKADREMMFVLNISAKGEVLNMEVASIGTLTQACAIPRELLKSVILSNAASMIMMHNHPSGDPTPSREDFEITERMQYAAELLGVHLLDHIIVGERGTYYSFLEEGVLEREILKEEKKTAERTR